MRPMIEVIDVVDWLESLPLGLEGLCYNSTIDGGLDKCVGVYSRRHPLLQPQSVGRQSSYGYRSISLLVHWTQSATASEAKAQEIWNELVRNHKTVIGNRVCHIDARTEPITIGQDDRGIFEVVLDFDITITN